MVASDGASSSIRSNIESLAIHPRSWGTFPKVIRQFCKENKQIGLEALIHKMTGLPALTLGLRNRGLIREGMKADLAIFDVDRVRDKATYTEPHQYSEGVEYVFVNGGLAIKKGIATGLRSGKVLRRE
jgi:N-acyl-D-aspartate/D-glutamate deacylase